MKHIAFIASSVLAATAVIQISSADEPADPKRVMVQMVSIPHHRILAVGLVVIAREDEAKTFSDLVERQIGPRWWPFTHADVYRFNDQTNNWEFMITRDTSTTKTIVGSLPGLRFAELRNGDVIRLTGNGAN